MLGVERNKHPVGRLGNILFGLSAIVDGLVRVVSLGFLHTNAQLVITRWQSKQLIKNSKINQKAP